MAAPTRPNTRLRMLIAQAGLTGEGLARAVNELGRECGADLRYRRASVSQWMAGTRPRPPVPGLVAEVLSRRLGRPVTPADTGLEQDPHPGEQPPATGANRLYDTAAVYRLLPPRDGPGDPVASPPPPLPGPPGPDGAGRTGAAHAGHIDDMTAIFSLSDNLAGSGAVLRALTAFRTSVAVPWLSQAGSPSARRALLLSCARLTYLGGFLHADHGHHGTAQNWYRSAADLARESGSPHTLAVITRTLSLQAHQLGHHDTALALAEHADTLATSAAPRTRAFLDGQLALALASAGRRTAAVQAIRRAERRLDRAAPQTPVVGAYHPASLAHQRAEVRHLLGDRNGALADLRLSARLRPATEPRARALVLARLAELTLAAGDLDGACAVWEQFQSARVGILSRRVDDAHRSMLRLFAPHRRHPPAARLLLPQPPRSAPV